MKNDHRMICNGCNTTRCTPISTPKYGKSIYRITKLKNQMGEISHRDTPRTPHLSSQPTIHSKRPSSFSALDTTNLYINDHVTRAASHLDKKLISQDCFNKIHTIAGMFPGAITSFLGFECRLAETNPSADFAFTISGVGQDRFVFQQLLKNNQLFQKLLSYPEWKRIQEFTTAWTDTKSVLFNNVKCFWIEFDITENKSDVPIPSVFFGPAKPSKTKGNAPDQYQWLFSDALPLLKGFISQPVQEHLVDCIGKIPLNAYVFQVGTMLSRENQTIRLFINKIEADQIIAYLQNIGWSEDPSKLIKIIEEIDQLVDRYVISFDVTEQGIGPKIGIECSFDTPAYDSVSQWNEFLEFLVQQGLCLPEKMEALLSYSGVDNTTMFAEPVEPLISASATNAFASCSTARFINHVKLVYRPGKVLEAKAYPAIRYYCSADQASHMKQK